MLLGSCIVERQKKNSTCDPLCSGSAGAVFKLVASGATSWRAVVRLIGMVVLHGAVGRSVGAASSVLAGIAVIFAGIRSLVLCHSCLLSGFYLLVLQERMILYSDGIISARIIG